MDRIYQRSGRGNFAAFVSSVNVELLTLGSITVPSFDLSNDPSGNYVLTLVYRPGGAPVVLFGAQDTAASDSPTGTIDAINSTLSALPEYLGIGIKSLTAKDSEGLMVRRVLVLASLGTPGVFPNGAVPLHWGLLESKVPIPPGSSGTVLLMTANPLVFDVGTPVLAENKGGVAWDIGVPLWVYFDQAAGAWYGFAECCTPGGP